MLDSNHRLAPSLPTPQKLKLVYSPETNKYFFTSLFVFLSRTLINGFHVADVTRLVEIQKMLMNILNCTV